MDKCINKEWHIVKKKEIEQDEDKEWIGVNIKKPGGLAKADDEDTMKPVEYKYKSYFFFNNFFFK